MKIVHIKQKLEEIGVELSEINLGFIDQIGEFTAKRTREPSDPNFSKYGFSYRANFERGILIYYLIRKFNLTSFLEVGFGRGFSAFCAARAFYDSGVDGHVISIEPNLDEKFLGALTQIFPKEWTKSIEIMKGTSKDVLPHLNEKIQLCLIDGDHSYEGTKLDWELTKDKFTHFMIFDDYHLSSKNDPGIQCRLAIDEIDWKAEGCHEPEFIKMDRRIFVDDRGLSDDQIDYGQVCLTKNSVTTASDW